MEAGDHNCVESCWFDEKIGNVNKFHYKQLKLNSGNFFRVDFTREVTNTGINVTITSITPAPNSQEKNSIEQIINELENKPKDGFECQALGWAYLGNISNNLSLQAYINSQEAANNNFDSIYYIPGYCVYGNATLKQFYDKS
jgi:hypothetical protein